MADGDKPNKWGIERVKVGAKEDLLVLKPMNRIVLVSLRVATRPFLDHTLSRSGPAISIHYDLRKGSDVLKSGSFALDMLKNTRVEIPVDAALEAMTEVVLWCEPYGEAAIVYPERAGGPSDSAKGRVQIPAKSAIHTGEIFYEFEVISGVLPFIVSEMNTNKRDADVAEWRRLNEASWTGMSPTALAGWTLMVAPGQPWDHKPVINRVWGARQRFGHKGYTADVDRIYRSDIHSNIHFGYVGRAAGFSQFELVQGASLAQRGSDVSHGDSPFVGDPVEDREAIEAGFALFGAGGEVTVAQVLRVIEAHRNWEVVPV